MWVFNGVMIGDALAAWAQVMEFVRLTTWVKWSQKCHLALFSWMYCIMWGLLEEEYSTDGKPWQKVVETVGWTLNGFK